MPSRLVSHGLVWLLAVSAALLAIVEARAFTPAEAKAPMTVTLVRSDAKDCGAGCPEWLALTGMIGRETPGLLRAALTRLGRRSVPVLIDSPGGNVDSGIAMGRMIRERKLDVIVAGTALTQCAKDDHACLAGLRAGEKPGFVAGGLAACASSCVLVLAGGTTRSVGTNSYVGVHQMVVRKTMNRVYNLYRVMRRRVGDRVVEVSRTLVSSRPVSSKTTVSAAPETLYSEVDRYLLAMGIGESIMPLMRSAPPSGIHWMLPYQLASTRIATDTTDARVMVVRVAERTPVSGTPLSVGAVTPSPQAIPVRQSPAQSAASVVSASVVSDAAVSYRLSIMSGARTVDGVAHMEWIQLKAADQIAAPGSTTLLGSLDVHAAGLRLTFEIGPSTDGPAKVALAMSLVETRPRFGPVAKLVVAPALGTDSRIGLLADSVTRSRYGGGYDVVLSPYAALADDATLELDFTDATGRDLTVGIPIEGALRTLLGTAAKARPTLG